MSKFKCRLCCGFNAMCSTINTTNLSSQNMRIISKRITLRMLMYCLKPIINITIVSINSTGSLGYRHYAIQYRYTHTRAEICWQKSALQIERVRVHCSWACVRESGRDACFLAPKAWKSRVAGVGRWLSRSEALWSVDCFCGNVLLSSIILVELIILWSGQSAALTVGHTACSSSW